MKFIRLIPKLDIKGKNLVKGINLEGLRVLGDPSSFVNFYTNNGADEIIYNDVVASLYGRNNILDLISKTARSCSIPITVSGGIRTIEDIKNTLKAGADKVAINTAAVDNPNFIGEAARTFGSSTIVINIESSFYNNEFRIFTNNGREQTKYSLKDWVKIIQNHGAGEILLTSIENEGTGTGFNTELIKSIDGLSKVPIILNGGARYPNDLVKVKKEYNIDAFALASMLHYNLLKHIPSDDFKTDLGNTSFIKSNKNFMDFGDFSMQDIKSELIKNKMQTRNKW
tara:strand:- start:202 stop:1053 length:852 start_codon:yes stop_codon:yes gene_type:complete